MILYGNRGMSSAALRVYEDCQKALQKELNVKPDQVTTPSIEKSWRRRVAPSLSDHLIKG